MLHSWLNTILSLFSECLAGFYGENCNYLCGHCLNEKTCHHINGMCDEECYTGYQTPLCTKGDDYCTNTFDKYYICLEL